MKDNGNIGNGASKQVTVLSHSQIFPPPLPTTDPKRDNETYYNKTVQIFYGNVSSLSIQTIDYIFALPKEVSAVALVETHKDTEYVCDKFNAHNYKAYPNSPITDVESEGTHGGEVVACRSHLYFSPVLKDILDHIAAHYGAPVCFAVMVLRF